ncbi:tetratricopeptide repeat-containing protein [Plasmopara halstedii]|uniref:Tetratricopeptide repeat-containing protein n=1 Tax=Plasmopara halstedii TaxID=4781 RepID=A0A0P1A7M0_PLAHL|nr:tetratricopeptide repeat-containing protein [Plasmopara halstedii]CEG36154.1 tetratricopeptide repeat-containing protein [Plasmopara halstedii]|eukprot:XP_024572523.1 tetratricopeptide repeat-containing protein [Plasmopara halstedii]
MANLRVFGVDFGAQRCVVAESNGDVVLNQLGGMTTATLVSFKGEERLLGESAVLSTSTNPSNTVGFLSGLVGKKLADVQRQLERLPGPQPVFEVDETGRVVVIVDYGSNGKKTSFTLEQLTGMLFADLATQMKKRLENEPFHMTLAVPSVWGDEEKQAVRMAGKIAGISSLAIISRDAALARCFHCKHPVKVPVSGDGDVEMETPRYIAIVDMGHTSTSVTVVKLTSEGETVLATEGDVELGAETLDRRLFEYFQKDVQMNHQLDISLHSKEGKRLYQACEKLKKLLSTIGEASVTVENLAPENDINISISRNAFEELCVVERNRVTEMVQHALAMAKEDVASADIASVEIVGGGTRIPFVQEAIIAAFPAEQQRNADLIGRMLDSTTAIALGAAYSSEVVVAPDTLTLETHEDTEELTRFVALEQTYQARDAELAAIAHERNAIESFVYEMRSKSSGKYGDKLDLSKLNPLLDAAEDWIYSEESETATLDFIRSKHESIEGEIRSACADYFSAVEADQRAFEQHLENESQKAELERQNEGGDDDHDTRKLKKPERMRMVVKNKDEGNELFRDGNFKHAAARYVKALTHASKFFDLSEGDKEEVNAIKLSLFLNLAQCYLKLESYSKAVANCNEALALESKNVKALYRRAMAYEKEKKLELAAADVKAALLLAPQDRAILKLDERLKLALRRQLDKEKKMWSKAFA